eukprot:scaffold523_cov237-Pinguiococcus_pyrenoidosus.AAC.6
MPTRETVAGDAAAQAQDAGVVEGGVQRLRPVGVQRTVQNDPLASIHCAVTHGADDVGEDPVAPVFGHLVVPPVQLRDAQGLRVHLEDGNVGPRAEGFRLAGRLVRPGLLPDALLALVHGYLAGVLDQSCPQRLPDGRLAAARRADQRCAHVEADLVVQLNHVLGLRRRPDEVLRLVHGLEHLEEVVVLERRRLHVVEKLPKEIQKELLVAAHQLGDHFVEDRLDHESGLQLADLAGVQRDVLGGDALVHARAVEESADGALVELAGDLQDAANGSQAKVVVVVVAQEPRAELEDLDGSPSELLGVLKALRHQDGLDDVVEVGNGHRYRAERGAQVVGHLRSGDVRRVDGRKHEMVPERHVFPFERDALDRIAGFSLALQPVPRVANHGELLRHHRQDVQAHAVEVVENDPGARLADAAEELGHHAVGHLVRAVEQHAEVAGKATQLLRRLGLARAAGSGAEAAEAVAKGLGENDPASLGQRGDDQLLRNAVVLVAVGNAGPELHHLDVFHAVIASVADLRLPVEGAVA